MKSDWDKLLKPNIFKRIKYKIDELRFRFYIWRDIKLGYIANDGQPLKCFKCKSVELEEFNRYTEGYGLTIEYSVKCKKCGQVLGHWAYGNWEM